MLLHARAFAQVLLDWFEHEAVRDQEWREVLRYQDATGHDTVQEARTGLVLHSDPDPTVVSRWMADHLCYVDGDETHRMLRRAHPRPVYDGQDDHDPAELLRALRAFFDTATPMTLRLALRPYTPDDA